MPTTLTERTPFVGRARELAILTERLDAAGRGRGGVLLLAGEAGIGKSRLVAEAKVRAVEHGFGILQGACFEPDRAFPYAPLLDLLRALATPCSADDLRNLFGPVAPEMLKLLPELAGRLPDVTAAPTTGPEQDRRRLFYALTRFFVALAAGQPLLVVIEDLHWCDDTSLDFLLALARRIAGMRVMLLLTYRSDEVHPMLGHVLAELERERLAVELALARFDAGEVDEMLRAIFEQRRPIRPDFLEMIHELTDGNPFFIEEVLKSLVETGDIFRTDGGWERRPVSELRIPRTVQDAVRRRSAGLSEAARETLALAAVAGQRFDFALLQDLTGHDERALLGLIKELIAAGLVAEESADRFAFRHALTRQAVEAELLARERRLLHGHVAEAIGRRYADMLDPHLADLAYHAYQAGAWQQALDYSWRVGEVARAMYGMRAAIEHFSRALEAARHLGVTPPVELHRARALASDVVGEFEPARADYEAALELARAAGDRRAEWQVLLDLGLLWAGRDYARAGECWQRALDLARTLDDPAALAHALNRVGNWHTNLAWPDEGLRHHQEALAIFERLGDERGTAETLDLLGLTAYELGDFAQSEAWYSRAIPLLDALDDRPRLAFAMTLHMGAFTGMYGSEALPSVAADRPRSFERGEQALAIARGAGWRAGEAYVLCNLGIARGLYGQYGRAFEEAAPGLALAEDLGHLQWQATGHITLGALYCDLLLYDEARAWLARALEEAEQAGSTLLWFLAGGMLARTCVRAGDHVRAEPLLAAMLDERPPHRLVFRSLALAARAELLLAKRLPDAALPLISGLRADAEALAPGRCVPYLWLLHGEALAALGREDDAEATLRASADAARSDGLRPLLWRVHLALGHLERARGRREAAEREFESARAIIDHLAAGLPDEPAPPDEVSLRARFLEAAATLLPRARTLTPLRAAKAAYGGLTARERDVAALVGRGLSNREIAAALVLSERTIEDHVSNILNKLDCTSRSQIAVWASEHGLLKGGA